MLNLYVLNGCFEMPVPLIPSRQSTCLPQGAQILMDYFVRQKAVGSSFPLTHSTQCSTAERVVDCIAKFTSEGMGIAKKAMD